MQRIHIRRKIVNQAKLRDGFARTSLAPERQTHESLQHINTTGLERLALNYECDMVLGLTEFERTAILKGIAAELAERTAEKVELRKVS